MWPFGKKRGEQAAAESEQVKHRNPTPNKRLGRLVKHPDPARIKPVGDPPDLARWPEGSAAREFLSNRESMYRPPDYAPYLGAPVSGVFTLYVSDEAGPLVAVNVNAVNALIRDFDGPDWRDEEEAHREAVEEATKELMNDPRLWMNETAEYPDVVKFSYFPYDETTQRLKFTT